MHKQYSHFRPRFQGNRNRRPNHSNNRSLDISMMVKKANIIPEMEYVAKHAFGDFALGDQVQRNIITHGYTVPTPIQDMVIPEVLAGRDVIGIAQTGTGKTAAFLLPSITKTYADKTQKVLIITPTRELAMQIDDEFRKFAQHMQLYSAACIGGMPLYRQIQALRRNPQFVVGTPGRLLDLEHQGKLNFGAYQTVVLDEVDRMLDMGFVQDITDIMSRAPQKRQTLFFSATLPRGVETVMQQFLKTPVTVKIEKQHASERVNQDVIRTKGRDKVELLHDLLIKAEFTKVLLFGKTKMGIERLTRQLSDRGFRAASIHGNKRQMQRQRTLDAFKNNRIQILLATDVASRGIDVADITHVINFDMPQSYNDYIHRIGRTGRADKVGSAITFVD